MDEEAAGPFPVPLARRLAAPLGTLAGAAAAVAAVGARDPGLPGGYPVCPLRRLTGVHCFGCGGLRAVHALAHGDVAAALGFNVLVVAACAVAAVLWTRWLAEAARGRGPGPGPVHVRVPVPLPAPASAPARATPQVPAHVLTRATAYTSAPVTDPAASAPGRGALRRFRPLPSPWWLAGAVPAVFMLARNLPFGAALAP